jgi:hypothetical protein
MPGYNDQGSWDIDQRNSRIFSRQVKTFVGSYKILLRARVTD